MANERLGLCGECGHDGMQLHFMNGKCVGNQERLKGTIMFCPCENFTPTTSPKPEGGKMPCTRCVELVQKFDALRQEHEAMVGKIRAIHDGAARNLFPTAATIRDMFPQIFAPEVGKLISEGRGQNCGLTLEKDGVHFNVRFDDSGITKSFKLSLDKDGNLVVGLGEKGL